MNKTLQEALYILKDFVFPAYTRYSGFCNNCSLQYSAFQDGSKGTLKKMAEDIFLITEVNG